MQKIQQLIIDPQNDFAHPNGSLFVQGADQDMIRLADFLKKAMPKLSAISVTLDSHHRNDIAHPSWWKDSSGNPPPPFTEVTKEKVESGVWSTYLPSLHKRSQEYVNQLEKNDRYPLCIWPPHCLISTWGNNVVDVLGEALKEWEEKFKWVNYVTKGSNVFTEHYSALKADVPDSEDPSTQINTKLIQTLDNSDIVLVAGEASSHCVKNSLYDIVEEIGDTFAKKIVLLEDCMSPVTGFEDMATEMFDKLRSKGVQIMTSVEFLKQI